MKKDIIESTINDIERNAMDEKFESEELLHEFIIKNYFMHATSEVNMLRQYGIIGWVYTYYDEDKKLPIKAVYTIDTNDGIAITSIKDSYSYNNR